MAIRLQPVDVVLVGMGMTGAILARELAAEGLSIVGLERGVRRDTVPGWQSPAMHDELRYSIRNELFENMAIEPFTFRNHLGVVGPHDEIGGQKAPRFAIPVHRRPAQAGARQERAQHASRQRLLLDPTGTVVALAHRSAKAIREQYLRSPGPLVR